MKFIVFVDRAGEWRWHLRASNGLFVACSGEGYKNLADCVNEIDQIKLEAPAAIVDLPDNG